ncbi:MAG TPA: phosphate/phosphite/phosphonate ABC transporter substrate-binding protein [Nitrospirota bacterium]|nr:phosphate/phosphite/phosphonate ABC transporter substrate-binding protein [Nitrospirota bacterium]
MWRTVNNLSISTKFLLTALLFIVIVVCLSMAAFSGLTRQKDITAELYSVQFKDSQLIAAISQDIGHIHADLLRLFRNNRMGSRAERANLLQTDAAVLQSLSQSLKDAADSGRLTEESTKTYRNLISEVQQYLQLLERVQGAGITDAVLVRQVLAAADERFASIMGQLQSMREKGDRSGTETFERSLGVHRSLRVSLGVLLGAAVCLIAFINLFIVRRSIATPIKSIEEAARKVSKGDLTFEVTAERGDEIGRAGMLLKESFIAMEGVLQRIKELSDRIHSVVVEVERTTEKVLSGAETEAEATSAIASSVAELNSAVDEIAGNTDGLVSASESASSSIDQMGASVKMINASIQELSGLASSTTVSIEQLSNAIRTVAHKSEDLENASEETSAAIIQIAASVREVETHAKESAGLSEQVTTEAATIGLDSIMKTIEGMKEIAATVNDSAAAIESLGKRSQEIEMIVGVIESVNEETNLLALNASILAAQAGEHGKGFAVVARKIKDLSDKTEKSTREIAALIQAVQREMNDAGKLVKRGIPVVEEGTRLAKAGEDALRRIMESSKRAAEMTLSIQSATEEQVKSAALVEEAATQVKAMVGDIARTTGDQSREATLIAQAAESMKKLAAQVSKATEEQAASSDQIAQTTQLVSERSHQISRSLSEHRNGSRSIQRSIEAVQNIPVENQDLVFKISKTLWNLQKDAELLGAEMERFSFKETRGLSLRFGVVPLKEPSEMFRKFKPLSDHLAAKLGRRVDLKVAIDMESAVKDLGDNVTQICAMGPKNYVEAHRKYSVVVIAKALRKNKPFHRAAIVVRKNSPIQAVTDLKGKRFAFGSIGSATSHVIPLAMLKNAGMTAADFRHYEFIGNHDQLVKAVLDGNFDAAGLIEEQAQKHVADGLRILAVSIEIPEFNICCNSSVDGETRDRFRTILTSLRAANEKDIEILQPLGKDCTGFLPASEKDYVEFSDAIESVADLVAQEFQNRQFQLGRR